MASILFVCLGNICRSPTAHAVFQHLVETEGLQEQINIASAGMGDWHVGKQADARARSFAGKRGYGMDHLRARQVSVDDFEHYDLILAMDRSNFSALSELCPPAFRHKIKLFLEFASNVEHQEVPDPYYGGDEGFELVLDLVENASRGLLEYLKLQGQL